LGSILAVRLDEDARAFWADSYGSDRVVSAESPVQLPKVAADFANLLETSGNQVAADTPATKGFSCAVGNAHCRVPFAAELVESIRGTSLRRWFRRGGGRQCLIKYPPNRFRAA
jgi:hypothetical protein